VNLAVVDLITRRMVRIEREASNMGFGLVDGEEGRLGVILASWILIGRRVGDPNFVEWEVESCALFNAVRVDADPVSMRCPWM
jgi:hypothetical protein